MILKSLISVHICFCVSHQIVFFIFVFSVHFYRCCIEEWYLELGYVHPGDPFLCWKERHALFCSCWWFRDHMRDQDLYLGDHNRCVIQGSCMTRGCMVGGYFRWNIYGGKGAYFPFAL